jgi:hypothetical protein
LVTKFWGETGARGGTMVRDPLRPISRISKGWGGLFLKDAWPFLQIKFHLQAKMYFSNQFYMKKTLAKNICSQLMPGVYTKMYVNKPNQNNNICYLTPAHAYYR